MFKLSFPRLSCANYLVLLLVVPGCRVCLPDRTDSNLWARAIEDRADWHLAQRGCPINPTHREHCMNDWSKGFYADTTLAPARLTSFPSHNTLPSGIVTNVV